MNGYGLIEKPMGFHKIRDNSLEHASRSSNSRQTFVMETTHDAPHEGHRILNVD